MLRIIGFVPAAQLYAHVARLANSFECSQHPPYTA